VKKSELTPRTVLAYLDSATGVGTTEPVAVAVLDTTRLWSHNRSHHRYDHAPARVKVPRTDEAGTLTVAYGYLAVRSSYRERGEPGAEAVSAFLTTLPDQVPTPAEMAGIAAGAREAGLSIVVVNLRKLHGPFAVALATVHGNLAAAAEANLAKTRQWAADTEAVTNIRARLDAFDLPRLDEFGRVFGLGRRIVELHTDTVAALLDIADGCAYVGETTERVPDVLPAVIARVHEGVTGTTLELSDGKARPQWALTQTQVSHLAGRLSSLRNVERCPLCGATACDQGRRCAEADGCEQTVHHVARGLDASRPGWWRDTYACECSKYDTFDIFAPSELDSAVYNEPLEEPAMIARPDDSAAVTRTAEVWSISDGDDAVVVEFIADTEDTKVLWSLPLSEARKFHQVLGQVLDMHP
jgi:hypothetical protein